MVLARAEVAVVGGGLHGCSVALHCALRGLSVVVVEKNSVGRHASGVNAGGVRRLGRHPAEIPISDFSMKLWRNIAALVDDDCGFQAAPQIKVAENQAELQSLVERATLVHGLGFEHEVLLDRRQLRDLLPAVAEHCVGGLASLDDGYAVPYLTTFAFQRKAQSLGVRFFEETQARDLTRESGIWHLHTDRGAVEAETLVNCGGAWGNLIAEKLGEPVPVEAIAPMMLVTAPLPRFCDAVVGATGRPLSFKQMPNGTVVIGGGRRGVADPETDRSDLRIAELRLTAQTAAEVFPVMARATIVRGWAGIEGRMPDDIPVIGPSSKAERVFHAFGFSAHGFQLGPGVGSILAELIATGATQAPLAPFSIGRFQAGG